MPDIRSRLLIQLSVRLFAWTIASLTVFAVVVVSLASLTGLRLASLAFSAPFLIYPIVWFCGLYAVWRKHRSIAILASLTVVGVTGFIAMPFAIYMATILLAGGWRVK